MAGPDELTVGHVGERVLRYQELLEEVHFPPGAVDGVYGPRTAAAVEAFQRALRLTPNGVIDERTARALAESAAAGENLVLVERNPFDPWQRHLSLCEPNMGTDTRTAAGR